MNDYDPTAVESIVRDTELERRTVRALTECMTVLPDAPDVYTVVTESGSEYTVDAREAVCGCPDYQHRNVRCKHLRRVGFATGERPVPSSVPAEAIDPQLGAQTDATPVHVAADGGTTDRPDTGASDDETPDESDESDDGRPDDCDCGDWNDGDPVDLPCWPCYRDGFEEPNPDA